MSNLKTGIKDDDVLESLLGDMKSTSKAKPGSAGKRKATSPPEKAMKTPGGGGSGGAGGPSSSINPFAKPKSTGIKRPKIKREVDDGDDSSSALDLLEYDDATASEAIEDVGDDEVKAAEMTATQNIEDFDEAELSNAMEEDFAEEKEEKKPDVACNRGFAVKSEEGAAKARVHLPTLKFDFISMQNSGQI